METGEGLTLAAIIVALLLGVWANFQTYWIRKEAAKKEEQEKKERLLFDIKEWLISLNATLEHILSIPFVKPEASETTTLKNFTIIYLPVITEFIFEYDKAQYFNFTASLINPEVEKAIIDLDAPAKLLTKNFSDFINRVFEIKFNGPINNIENILLQKKV